MKYYYSYYLQASRTMGKVVMTKFCSKWCEWFDLSHVIRCCC